MFDAIMSNPEQVTFTVLFVSLLVYVMTTNDSREKQYRETINRLTQHFEVVKDIEAKVDKVTTFIYKNTKDKE